MIKIKPCIQPGVIRLLRPTSLIEFWVIMCMLLYQKSKNPNDYRLSMTCKYWFWEPYHNSNFPHNHDACIKSEVLQLWTALSLEIGQLRLLITKLSLIRKLVLSLLISKYGSWNTDYMLLLFYCCASHLGSARWGLSLTSANRTKWVNNGEVVKFSNFLKFHFT